MNKLYNKIYNAINKGLYETLIIDPFDDNNDVSINYSYSNIVSVVQHTNNKLATFAKQEQLDLEKVLAHELLTNNLSIYFNKSDYEIKYFKESSLNKVIEDGMYDEMRYLQMSNINIKKLDKINEILQYTGWRDHSIDNDNNPIYQETMSMIKNIYTSDFINNYLKGIYFSLSNSMVCIMYGSAGRIDNVDFIIGCAVTEEIFETCSFGYEGPNIKNYKITKYIAKLRLTSLINTHGFIPVYDNNGNLCYENYFICDQSDYKKQYENNTDIIQHCQKFYTKLLTKPELKYISNTSNLENDISKAEFLHEFEDGTILDIYQFSEKERYYNKCGWRIEVR